jgi:hypothetical protein
MRRVRISLTLLGLICGSFGWAQTAPNNVTNFPMIGVTRGQTLQINLLAFPPNPCSATIGFQNGNGSPIGTSKVVTLAAGQSVSLAINGNSLTSAQDQRVEVLPTVVANPNESQSQCVASAEIFASASGVTSILVPGTVGLQPQSDFGMVGVTSVQTVRLNVVAFPPNPCIGQLSFVNSKGVQVGTALNVQLAVGQASFLDLPGTDVVTKTGQRAMVHPIVTVSNGATCIASTEVYSNSLGTTAAYYPPNPCSPSSTSCIVF